MNTTAALNDLARHMLAIHFGVGDAPHYSQEMVQLTGKVKLVLSRKVRTWIARSKQADLMRTIWLQDTFLDHERSRCLFSFAGKTWLFQIDYLDRSGTFHCDEPDSLDTVRLCMVLDPSESTSQFIPPP